MGKVVKTVVGIGLVVAGAITGNVSMIMAGAGLALSKSPKVGKQQQNRQASALQIQIGEVPRQAIFGQAATAGNLLDGFNYGGTYGTDWEVLVISLADHRCEALVGFYVNDEYVPFTGNGAVAGYSGKLVVTWYAGTEDQTADPTCTAYGPGWTADDRLRGVSYAVVAYMADGEKEKHPTWTAGRPNFLFVLKGALCYDPRKDSTVAGGSGPHRWADPTTREWSENLIVCRYNYGRGLYACDRVDQPDQLLIGRGMTVAEAPPERVAAAANICDEAVPVAGGGTEPRYRVSAIIGADEAFLNVEQKFAEACAGVLIQPGGSIEVEPGHAKAAVASFTDGDLVVGRSVTFSRHRSVADDEWCNTVAARYNEPEQKWQEHGAPVRRVLDDLTADGGQRLQTPQLSYVAWRTQAQRIAEIKRRMGRLTITAGCTLGPRFCEVEEGDWIEWTSARRNGGVPITFRVETYSCDEGWRKTLQLREIGSDVFGWSADDELAEGAVAEQQPPPDEEAYVKPGGSRFVTWYYNWPLTSDDTSITVAAFSGLLNTNEAFSLPAGGPITGLTPGVKYLVLRPYAGGDYWAVVADSADAAAAVQDPDNLQVGYQFTSDGGTYTPPPSPPGGGGPPGGGNNYLN